MGEAKLRNALSDEAALSTSLVFRHETNAWHVRVRVWTDEVSPPIDLVEPLDEFPSPTLVAQAMLVT